ncbi:MAG: hypothetical protein GY822_21870 [Deltaproteobacteria bacterium]|nr:hypothetical protein [Deltaproteobacteria bacterium]
MRTQKRKGVAAQFIVVLVCMTVVHPTLARRMPALGEKVTLSLDSSTLAGTRHAHLFLPLLEKLGALEQREALAYPAIKGFSPWRSQVIRSMERTLASRVWLLEPALAPALVERSLRRCLAPNQDVPSWPADVLAKAEVSVEVESAEKGIYLRFSKPVGPLPHLLAGCVLYSSHGNSSGPYVATSRGVLTGRQDALRGTPSMSLLEFRPKGTDADVVLGGEDLSERQVVSAPFPDVIVLMQSRGEAQKDRFGFKNPERHSSFRKAIDLDALVDVFAIGRGAPTLELLPPGLVPARKLRELPQKVNPLPLRLVPIGKNAPTVPIAVDANDALLTGTMERLRVMARSQGVLLRRHRTSVRTEGWSLIRWSPRSADPGVALLDLAAHNDNLELPRADSPLFFQLLDEDEDTRLQAALQLEAQWMAQGVVIPLLRAERWFTLHPLLKRVRVRDDGMLLVSDAHWGATP